MTLDEFMRDIAPKMKKGWIAMDKDDVYSWNEEKPVIRKNCFVSFEKVNHLPCFDIEPVEDWTKSLREVGNEL